MLHISFLSLDTASPLRKVLTILGLIVAVVVVAEIIGLLLLRSQVARYREYWNEQNKTATGELTYVALGDSAAQGIGATSPRKGYVGLIAKRLEEQTGKSVKLINLSKTGATVADGLENQIPELDKYQPDIVTVELGANDVKTLEPELFRKQFNELLSKLPAGTFISDIPDFGWGPHLQKQRRAAEIAREEIATFPELNFVPLDSYTQEHFNHFLDYAPDFFHPDSSGYRVWADAYWQEIKASL